MGLTPGKLGTSLAIWLPCYEHKAPSAIISKSHSTYEDAYKT